MKFPKKPPDTGPLLTSLIAKGSRAMLTASPTLPDGRYLHWDDLRYRTPPSGLTHEEWWACVKFARAGKARDVGAISRCYDKRFTLVELPAVLRALHEFDRVNVGDRILSALGNSHARVEYRARQLIEEAISSSEIEGARLTTREQARQMLRETREPASKAERMVFNNLKAMERLRELHTSKTRLELAHLLELHRILGDDALDVEGAAGVLRGPTHDVHIDDNEGNTWYTPPDAHGIEQRVEALLSFANGEGESPDAFVHPIVRAIVAHFWLAYEHPFRDGNGRIARALFYWCMLQNGYEVAEFLSISGPIDRAPKAYYLAFAHAETDSEDLTYFVLHQIEIMNAALRDLVEHLTRRAARMRTLADIVASFNELNHRQRSFLEHAIHHPHEGSTIKGHAASHVIHYITASQDLADLEKRGLVESRTAKQTGRTKRYYPAPKLLKRALPAQSRPAREE